jgi:hypothetical protein
MPALETIRLRRGTAAQWTTANPVLAQGEPGHETDTGNFKIGDGTTAWSSLPYTARPGANAGVWSAAGTAGYTNRRPQTDILMSTYDTNPTSTDQTAAFAAAFAAAAAIIVAGTVAHVRIILDTRLKYSIGGAVTSGANGQYAQVALPYLTDTQVGCIELVGIPRGNEFAYIGTGNSGTVIESTLSSAPTFSATNGIASIFGGPASFRTSPGTYPTSFSFLKFATTDITIRSASPVICGIDGGWLTGRVFNGQMVYDTDYLASQGANYGSFTQCTAPQAIPEIFPFSLDWFGTTGDDLTVAGWAYGPMLGEYLRCRSVTVFGTACALLCDVTGQTSRIDYLTDWNNAYGVGAISGTFANNTIVSPGSGYQTGTAPGSKYAMSQYSPAAAIDLGTWQVQTSQGGGSRPLRVYDGLDANNLIQIDCPAWASKTDGGSVNLVPSVIGFGGTATGILTTWRVQSKASACGPSYQTAPATTVVARNPVGRDCLLSIQATNSATITAFKVNGNVQSATATYPVMLPANGNYSLTYTGTAPELCFMPI